MIVKCPSGLAGSVRKLKGSEVDILSDRAAAKKGETFDKLLAACWEKTSNQGPYGFDLEGSVPWSKILVCDRMYALIAIRVATFGAGYIFPVQCTGRACGEKFEWEINLTKDLTIYDLPAETLEKIKAGDNHFLTEVDGQEIGFRLLDGEAEKKVGKRVALHRDQLMTTALASRIVSIGGEPKNHVAVEAFLKEMDMDAQLALLSKFEEVDGGVDQVIEVECPHCMGRQTISLPLEAEGFWIPSSRLQRKQTRIAARQGTARRMDGTIVKGEDEEEPA